MVELIKIESSSPLHSQHSVENKKLVLNGREFTWMTHDEIKNQKGNNIVHSLRDVALQLKNAKIVAEGEGSLDNLLFNLALINKKIERHNNSIEENAFLNFIDVMLVFITKGSSSLKYDTIDNQIQNCQQLLRDHPEDLSLILKKYSESPKLLLGFPELVQPLVDCLKGKSNLAAEDISNLEKIISSFPEESQKEEVKAFIAKQNVLPNYLDEQKEKAKPSIQETDTKRNIQFVKDFVAQNLSEIKVGAIGSPSKKDAQIIKFKASEHEIPHDISYNRTNGDIVVNYGKIGEGAYKVVKKKMSLLSNQMLAVGKQQLKPGTEEKKMADREIEFMKPLKGKPNVLQLHEVSVYRSEKKGEVQCIMTEFCDMGELKGHMGSLTEKQKVQVAKDIAKGVLEIHNAGIIHRDIKPENILLKSVVPENKEREVTALVGDFGLSCYVENDPDIRESRGTLVYLAPEITQKRKNSSFASDTWAVGMVFAQLFGDLDLEKIKSYPEYLNLLSELKSKPEPDNKESIEHITWKLLQEKPKNRMDLGEALTILEKL